MRLRLRLLSGVLCAVVAGCAPAPQVLTREPGPEAGLTEIRVETFDERHAELQLVLAVLDPRRALALEAADYQIFLDNRVFASGTSQLAATVVPGAPVEIRVPVRLSHLDLPRTAERKSDRGEPLLLVARGVLRGVHGGEPVAIEFDGERPLQLSTPRADE